MGTLLGFAAKLAAIQGGALIAQQHALSEGAKIVHEEAQDRIGTYQSDAGPFAAWPTLAPSTIEERVRLGYSATEPLLRTGEMRESLDWNASPFQANIGSDCPIAKAQELGDGDDLPARSFLGGAAFSKEQEVVDKVAQELIVAYVIGSIFR